MKGGSWITLSLKTEEIEQSTDCQASAQFVLYVTKQNKTKKNIAWLRLSFSYYFFGAKSKLSSQRRCDRIVFVSLTFQAFLVIIHISKER